MSIYRFLFQGARFTINQQENPPSNRITVNFTPATARRCGVLLTCKTFRQEAQPILGDEMHLVFWLRGLDIRMISQDFKDVYFPRLKSLELSSFNVDLTNFPNLEILYWYHLDVVHGDFGPPGDLRAFLKSSDIESLIPHATGSEDASFVEAWMKLFFEFNSGAIAAAEAAVQNGEQPDINEDVEDYWRVVQAVRSKDRNYRVAAKADFNLVLISLETGAWGKSISLILVSLHPSLAGDVLLTQAAETSLRYGNS